MNLLTRLKEIRDLPTLPEVVFQVQHLLSSDDSDARKLTRVIEHDPALAAKILRVANSTFYTPTTQRINDLSLAIARIGFKQVHSLIVATEVIRTFSNELRALSHRSFWRHSLSAAYLCEEIGRTSGNGLGKDALVFFLAGLFHDIGILAYDQFFHQEFSSIIGAALDKQVPYLKAEELMPQLPSHALLGGALLETWRVDTDIVSAVRYHHNPSKSSEKSRVVVNVVHAAEVILCNGSIGAFEGSTGESLADACALVNIPIESICGLLSRSQNEATKYDLLIGSSPLIDEFSSRSAGKKESTRPIYTK